MRYSLIILWLFLITATKPISYSAFYVSNSGNDANSGGSPATPWRTIAKVNASTFLSGDSILFQDGGTWNEELIPNHSNLYFGSYGTGVKPVITGFKTVTGFTDSSNIWSTTDVTLVSDLNTVLINGTLSAKGRYPNTGYLNFTDPHSRFFITTSLSGTPNY